MRRLSDNPAGILCLAMLFTLAPDAATGVTVSARVVVKRQSRKEDHSAVVMWLTPTSDAPLPSAASDARHSPYRLVQRHKQFTPHLLVVPAGATVEFPNLDPFFHNVFSLFDGKRFDLGLYEAGTTRSVKFDRPGICYIFCNIHPEMGAVVVVMKTPYYGVSSSSGEITILNVPPGRYRLEVWQEAALPEDLKKLSREVTVSPESRFLGTLNIKESGQKMIPHKNKYGRDYDDHKSPSPLSDYSQ